MTVPCVFLVGIQLFYGANVPAGGGGGGGGGGQTFTEDFESPVGDSCLNDSAVWLAEGDGSTTEELGISDHAASQGARPVDGASCDQAPNDIFEAYYAFYTNALCNGTDQWVLIEVSDAGTASENTTAGLFRHNSTGRAADTFYIVEANSGGNWKWARINTGTYQLIETGSAFTKVTGDYLGFAVTGIGASTVVKAWDHGASDPGDDFSTWGAATWTSTQDPTNVGGMDYSDDSGKGVGFEIYYANGTVALNDNWSGGDQ